MEEKKRIARVSGSNKDAALFAALDAGLLPKTGDNKRDSAAFERFWELYNARKPLKEVWGMSKDEYMRARKSDKIYMTAVIVSLTMAAIALAANFIAILQM